MVSSFPKMQKSSASFSQSIRNRLRLKNLQAQAKNFCRVLDIRVAQIMEPHNFTLRPFQCLLHAPPCVAGGNWSILLHRGREHPPGVYRLFIFRQHLQQAGWQDDGADG